MHRVIKDSVEYLRMPKPGSNTPKRDQDSINQYIDQEHDKNKVEYKFQS